MSCNSGAEKLLLNIGHFALGMPRNATGIKCAGAFRNATHVLLSDGDAGQLKKTARALKIARKHGASFSQGVRLIMRQVKGRGMRRLKRHLFFA
jgi:hypothetical protein